MKRKKSWDGGGGGGGAQGYCEAFVKIKKKMILRGGGVGFGGGGVRVDVNREVKLL